MFHRTAAVDQVVDEEISFLGVVGNAEPREPLQQVRNGHTAARYGVSQQGAANGSTEGRNGLCRPLRERLHVVMIQSQLHGVCPQ